MFLESYSTGISGLLYVVVTGISGLLYVVVHIIMCTTTTE